MIPNAALLTDRLEDTIELQEMVMTVWAIGEWLVKQQQQLSLAQRQLEEQQRQIEVLQKENEQLKDSLQKLKNRSSENSSVPPSTDQLKKPSRPLAKVFYDIIKGFAF
jgi:septation ring formation regulator EzrA